MSTHRTTLLAAMTAVLALGMMAPAAAAAPAISSPSADEIVYWNTLELAGSDVDAAENTVQWAVREGTCAVNSGTVAGNVDGFSDASSWAGGYFSATLDITAWDAGEYCFVLNTTSGAAAGARQTQLFYVVDEYAKIGGTLYIGGTEKGMSPTHALQGLVGDAGAAGIVGSIEVNYRELGTSCTFTPGDFAISSDDTGIALDGFRANLTGWDGSCDNGDTTTNASIYALDRDADSNRDAPRGAIVLRWLGGPNAGNDYEIDGTPGTTGPDSWVALDRGNIHVGTR